MVAAKALRIPLARPEDVADRRGNDPLEDRVSLGDLDELIDGIAEARAALRLARHADAHQIADVLIRKGIQDDGVKHAVDGGRGHDPEREGQDRHGGESGASRQAPDAELHIAPELFEKVHHDCSCYSRRFDLANVVDSTPSA